MNRFVLNSNYTDIIMNHLEKSGLCNNGNTGYQMYTLQHKQAFVAVQLSLMGGGGATESGILHDVDKLVTYGLMGKKEVSKLHRKYARHHIENCINCADCTDCIIDYECARFTKEDKPLNAYKTVMKYCPERYITLLPSLINLGLNKETDVDIDFRLWNQQQKYLTEYMARRNIATINNILLDIKELGIEKSIEAFYTR